jgi:hypothetical protein
LDWRQNILLIDFHNRSIHNHFFKHEMGLLQMEHDIQLALHIRSMTRLKQLSILNIEGSRNITEDQAARTYFPKLNPTLQLPPYNHCLLHNYANAVQQQ